LIGLGSTTSDGWVGGGVVAQRATGALRRPKQQIARPIRHEATRFERGNCGHPALPLLFFLHIEIRMVFPIPLLQRSLNSIERRGEHLEKQKEC